MSNNKSKEHGKVLAEWKFPETIKYSRSRGWYIGAGICGVALLVYAVATKNFLFGLIIILFALTLFITQRKPADVGFKITEDGILIGSRFYPYKEIKNFFIIYEPPEVKSLYFNFKNIFNPHLPIPLEKQDPVKVRKILLEYLPEDLTKEDEPFSDQISRMFKL